MARSSALHNEQIRDKFREECGLFGIMSSQEDAARLTFLGLHALQHRGQESGGMAVMGGKEIRIHKDMGLVADVFSDEILNSLPGKIALGHVRYSTTGSSRLENAQPLLIRSLKGSMAIAHNGNLLNSRDLRLNLEKKGAIFHSSLDTEIIAHLLAHAGTDSFTEALMKAMNCLEGAYALLIMKGDCIYGLRDPHGFRPLILGRINGDYVLASESCALPVLGAEIVREVEPGEMVILQGGTYHSLRFAKMREKKFCSFEYIYFARPDSMFNGKNVHLIRKAMGKCLAREYEVDADIVVAVPDSGFSAAQGFSEEAGIPQEMGLLKNKYVGRTFILPRQSARDLKVKLKLSPLEAVLRNKRVVLIDDSIVRGTTSRKIVNMVREAGAREVHLGICSPPVIYSCYYGLDTTNRQELIASQKDSQEICRFLQADSIHYLSLQGMYGSLEGAGGLCDACFSGSYPLAGSTEKGSLEVHGG